MTSERIHRWKLYLECVGILEIPYHIYIFTLDHCVVALALLLLLMGSLERSIWMFLIIAEHVRTERGRTIADIHIVHIHFVASLCCVRLYVFVCVWLWMTTSKLTFDFFGQLHNLFSDSKDFKGPIQFIDFSIRVSKCFRNFFSAGMQAILDVFAGACCGVNVMQFDRSLTFEWSETT